MRNSSFSSPMARYLARVSVFLLCLGVAPIPSGVSQQPPGKTCSPFERALAEHQLLFGEDSSILLIDPDAYLSPTGFDTAKAKTDILGSLTRCAAPLTAEQHTALGESMDLLKASTEFLGPASIRVKGLESRAGKPVVLIVSYDSARPLQIAIHSLSDVSDPTILLLPQISFEEFQSFTRFHESAHAFQHLCGAHDEEASENPYLHAHEEAEADAFAVLCWYRLREANPRVARIWHSLRLSRYIEMLRMKRMDPAMEYFTHSSVAAALVDAEALHREGALARMSGAELYQRARGIARATIPPKAQLTVEATQLADALTQCGAYPLRKRLKAIDNGLANLDATSAKTLRQYCEGMQELLTQSCGQTPGVSQRQRALDTWTTQLERDLSRSEVRALVLDRVQVHLAGETLDLAFSSAEDAEKKMIKTDGHDELPFVPIDQKYRILEEMRQRYK